jgi:mannosyltransferase OCH1-like enzyme
MIPRILHRVWICPPGPPMPAEFVGYGERWRQLHPTWQLQDWARTADLEPMVNRELYDHPVSGHEHRSRADVVRLESLWRFGGVYVDTDVEPVRALDPLLEAVQRAGASAFIVWSANRWRGRRLVSNAVIGAEPEHPWVRRAMAGLPPSVAANRGRYLAIQTVHYLTDLLGPLTAGVTADGVLVLPEATFYPRSSPARRAGRPLRIGAGTYAVHHWAHSRGAR